MRTQMKFQKCLCFIMLIMGALTIVYAVSYCSCVLAGLGTCIISGEKFLDNAWIYEDIQGFNDSLLYLGIVVLLAVVVLYITATNTRRNYYITNYIASIIVAVLLIGISLYVMILNGYWLGIVNEFLNDATAIANYLALSKAYSEVIYYSTNTITFILGFVLYGLIIVAAVLLVLNLVWKTKLMKGERALLEKGLEKEVA